jgi:hypothetical protein
LALSIGAVLVLLGMIGAVYLEIALQAGATRTGWIVNRELAAGTVLTPDVETKISIPATSDVFNLTSTDPAGSQRRLAHAVSAHHLLSDDDLLAADMAEVTINLKAAPTLISGDSIDVYAMVETPPRPVLIGRSVLITGNGATTILVPSGQELDWITLSANNVALFAAKSSGINAARSALPSPGGGADALNAAMSTLAAQAAAR